MARKFLTAIDLGTNELQNAVIQNLAAASEPTGVKGRIYFDSTNNLIKFYDGSAWKALATGGDLGSYQPLDADLTAISAISGTGIAVRTASDTWSTITDNSSNWNTAYGWGNHASAGYATLTGVETLTNKTISDSLTFQNTGSTNTIYATGNDLTIYGHNNVYINTVNADINLQPDGAAKIWGNTIATQTWVSGQGYLTSYTETDPIYTASSWYTTTNNSSNWDTAYGWGNHASAGYLTVAATSVTGTANEITVSGTGSDPYTGAITIGLPDNVTIGGNLTVTGDLNVTGTVNAVNTTEINIQDNTIILNSSFTTGTPIVDAGIHVQRGSEVSAQLYWNESMGSWWAGIYGNMHQILTSGVATASDISDFNTAVDTEIDAHLSGSNSISYSSGAIDTTLATTSYMSKSSGLAVDVSSLETKLVTDGFTKKYAAQNSAITISGGVATWTVTHNLGSRDVNVQVYEVSGYGAVEVDVVRTSTSVVTLSWNAAANVSADTYRVVVTG